MNRRRSNRSSFLDTPHRVALAGDWHANTDYGVMAIAHARKRNADVITHLGDFGFNFTDDYLDALDHALATHDLILGFVDGNHENFDWLLTQPVAADGLRYLRDRVVHLPRGFRWQWDRTRCLAVGGAHSIDSFLRTPNRTWWSQEEITTDQAQSIRAGGHADAMFCHDCPAGVTVPGLERERFGFPPEAVEASERGRRTLRGIVDIVQPTRLWHGHFHYRYQSVLDGAGYRTVIDGLGRDKQPIDNNLVVANLTALGSRPSRGPEPSAITHHASLEQR
uniref:metallophosphatase n=1 Tax=Rhodococcus opacus TaxID=37919 RepID=UPI003F658D44